MLPQRKGFAGDGTLPSRSPPPMRAYWIIALIIGIIAASVCLPLLLMEIFAPVSDRVEETYTALGWLPSTGTARLFWLEGVLLFVASIGVASGIVGSGTLREKLLVAAFSFGLLLLASPTFALYGIMLDPICLSLAGLLAIGGGLGFSRTRLGQRRVFLESALGSRISERLFREMLEGSAHPDLASVTRETATLICRMFPDTGNAAASPEEVLKRGSHFRRAVTGFLLARGAVINEAGPEKVSATFGMIRDEDNPAAIACRAALDLRTRLTGLSQECETRWFRPLRWGIGIAGGSSIVGLCGTRDEPVYSMLGGGCGLADRLALANARHDSDLLIESTTLRMIGREFEVRPIEALYDPERQSLSEVYQLLGTTAQFSEEERQRRDHFWKGVIFLRERKTEAALEALSRARHPTADDPVLAKFLARAQQEVVAPESRETRLAREFTDDGYSRLLQKL